MNKEIENLLNKCNNCKLKECIGCEFTYTDIQKIKKYVEQKSEILDKVTDKLEEVRRELDDDGFGYYAQEITNILNIIEREKK